MARILYSLCGADGVSHYSPHVWKIIMALKHKGLDFELRPVTFKDIPLIENGAFKSVPALNDNGHLEGDSFQIAVYLDRHYPDRPSLFGGNAGQALSRFVECFGQTVLHPPLSVITVAGMHSLMPPEDQAHFRTVREKRFGKTLEEIASGRERELASFPEKLSPLRALLAIQPWLGGEQPHFADYVLFGSLQWARVTSAGKLFAEDDPVESWFGRCLELCGDLARPAAAA